MRRLAGSAPPGAEALDLASFRWRYVVGSPAHLAHEPLLLDLAAELPKRLLELFGILDDDSHNRKGYLMPGQALQPEGGRGISGSATLSARRVGRSR